MCWTTQGGEKQPGHMFGRGGKVKLSKGGLLCTPLPCYTPYGEWKPKNGASVDKGIWMLCEQTLFLQVCEQVQQHVGDHYRHRKTKEKKEMDKKEINAQKNMTIGSFFTPQGNKGI